ncbi:MAG: PASTA domain-containing protein [Bacteroidales bacterium]|jgi:beta-lactam-binding protein with PASTA domain|nr:PASTA domain-containing protein [Bacteroidales bacterium]
MKKLSFIKSKYFWKNLALIILVGIILVWITMFILRLYTFHGQSIEVPDFVGKTMMEIDEMRESRHYNFVVVDSVYDNSKKPGSVSSQLPLPASHVKKGRTVYLTLIAFTPEKTKLPNLIDLTARQSSALLESHGLKVGRIEYVPDVGKTVLKAKYKGRVLQWGHVLNKGEKVDLVIGRGKGEGKVYIPKLLGKTRDEARLIINDAGLNLGGEVFMNPKDTINVRVVKQSPRYSEEAEINLGETIDLWYE